MSVDPLASWYTQPVAVERFIGSGAFGDEYAAVETVLMAVDDKRRLVRAPDGSEVVSETTLAHPVTVTAIAPRSRVTLPATFGGRTSLVITSSVGISGLPTPDHVELAIE
jgi:hypothetical protein